VIRVLVADDDREVRGTLRDILGSDPDVEIVAEATTGREAELLAQAHRPDVVLLDIRMPGTDGLAAAREIRRRRPGQRIVMLTTFGEAEYVRQAIALGVNGFLLKAGNPVELLAGLHVVMSGGACLSPTVATMVIEQGRTTADGGETAARARAALAVLPVRERDVLELLAQGRTNAEIATTLHLSEATVKGYVSSAFTRLGLRNRVEAALLAWQAR
jgi:DNA-binding NarL/FixJ family response regulator